MKVSSESLLNELKELTQQHIDVAYNLLNLSIEDLTARPSVSQWNVLECIEHLNLYGDYYLPEITRVLQNNTTSKSTEFKSSWLGNYFSKSMMPKKDKLNTMKTFKDKDPMNTILDKKVIERFLTQQNQTLSLLEKARDVNMSKIKTGISISKWIKLRLGDTFRVLIYHNDRHIVQALKLVK